MFCFVCKVTRVHVLRIMAITLTATVARNSMDVVMAAFLSLFLLIPRFARALRGLA